MKIGYKGITPYSVKDEDNINQDLLLEGCKKIVTEKATSFSENRMTLMTLVKSLEKNQELVVCSLRFLAQNTKQLMFLIELIENKGSKLTVLDMGNSLSSHFKALKNFESYTASAKIKQGKSNSNARQGRKPIKTETVYQVINDKKYNPSMSISEIARRADISRSSVNRILNDQRKLK
jgi:DNA invertase Pin-like site-specific DNA recombinase